MAGEPSNFLVITLGTHLHIILSPTLVGLALAETRCTSESFYILKATGVINVHESISKVSLNETLFLALEKLVLEDEKVEKPMGKIQCNNSLKEYRTLENLAKDNSVIIKQANKGGVTVIVNTYDYLLVIRK